MADEAEDLKRELTTPAPKYRIQKEDWLSTGSTLLNLAITGHPQRGFWAGGYFWIVGDSESGKTWFSMTCLAEAVKNKRFQNHRFIFDDVEGGSQMNIARFFGKTVEAKIEAPGYIDNVPVYSRTIEDFLYSVDSFLKMKQPFIYILDSMDGLTTDDDEEKFQEKKEAKQKGKSVSGSYGTYKARANSAGIRVIANDLRKTGSILIIISQTRANIGFGSQFNPKVVSGGNALKFFAQFQIWTSIKGELKRRHKGHDIPVGTNALVKVKKNRATGGHRTVEIPFINDLGIDDVLGCINYLVEWKHWKKAVGDIIHAVEFDKHGDEDTLIKWIEDNNKELELKKIVWKVWSEIEKALTLERKPRYV